MRLLKGIVTVKNITVMDFKIIQIIANISIRKARIKKFEENSYYSIVTKENIDDIKSYFDKFPYESMEDSNKYDFETDNINEGDYYSLKAGSNNDNYSVFLYDVNSHILYYIHYNIQCNENY